MVFYVSSGLFLVQGVREPTTGVLLVSLGELGQRHAR